MLETGAFKRTGSMQQRAKDKIKEDILFLFSSLSFSYKMWSVNTL